MRFRTKWELLEYLGVDKKYVRKVDRMMVKGIVSMVDGEYEYIDPAREEIDRLKDTVKMLEEENKELKDKNNKLFLELLGKEDKNTSSDDIIDKVYKYLVQVAHLHVDKTEFKEWLENN